MKIVILTSGTNNTKQIYEPLRMLGHELNVIVYDAIPTVEHNTIPPLISNHDPDAVVYIGAIAKHHGRPVPSTEILAIIGSMFPMVHVCCDGAEPAWWPTLQDYYDHGRFQLQVNIDGVRTGPIGDRGLTLLCPVQFDQSNWTEKPRTIEFGFAGNTHGGDRLQMLTALVTRGLINHRGRDDAEPDGYIEYMRSCVAIWNHPMTGGLSKKHVKARIIEATLTGCVVFEQTGSPAADWFEPGVDYVAYTDIGDIESELIALRAAPERGVEMQRSLLRKVKSDHAPSIFWSQVFHRMGLQKPLKVLKQPPYLPWDAHETAAPELLSSHNRLNLVAFAGMFYVVPQGLGPLDFTVEAHRKLPGILTYKTADAARRSLNG